MPSEMEDAMSTDRARVHSRHNEAKTTSGNQAKNKKNKVINHIVDKFLKGFDEDYRRNLDRKDDKKTDMLDAQA